MPSTIELFPLLGSNAQTGGSWTYTGTITPAPTAPVTYNGTADFSSVTALEGAFPFEYEITQGSTTDTKTVTVNFKQNINHPFDTCATADFMGTLTDPTAGITSVGKNVSTAENCTRRWKPATASGVAQPTNWPAGTYYDTWIKIRLAADPTSAPYRVEVQVTSSPVGEDPMTFPMIAVYANSWGTVCGSITEIDSVGPDGEYSNSTGWWHDSLNADQVYIRIAHGPLGQAGIFDVDIEINA